MKINKLIAIAAFMLAICGMCTSCLSNKDDHYKVTQSYPGYFNAVTDLNDGKTVYFDGISYTIEFDIDANTANLKLNGFKLPDGTSFPTLEFNEVPWRVNDRGWQEISLMNYQPEGVGSYSKTPVFTSFLFQSINRYIPSGASSMYVPCVSIKYTIDNYLIYSLPQQIVEIGTTTVTNLEDKSEYQPDKNTDPALYIFQLNTTKGTANITISGAKFHKDMPAMNMRFPDVPFVTTSAGDILFECESLIPEMLSGSSASTATATPMPMFPISNLKVTYDPDRGIWVDYTCTMKTDKISGAYQVNMINKYPDKVDNK